MLDTGFSRDLRIQKAGKNGGGLLPFLGFLLNLFAASSRELVKLRLPIVVRKTPFGTDVSLLFQLEQRRIEGPVIDGQEIGACLLDLARNPIAMQRPSPFEGFQDHQRQRPLPHVCFGAHERDATIPLLESNMKDGAKCQDSPCSLTVGPRTMPS